MYDFWQFLHVVSAITWVGAAILSLFLSFRLAALKENPVAGPAAQLTEAASVPLFVLTSMLTLVTGLILAFGWVGFEPLWIKIGLGGIAVSLVMGFGYFKPTIGKLQAMVQERGHEDAGVQAVIRQVRTASAIEVVIFLIVVWAMVTKP